MALACSLALFLAAPATVVAHEGMGPWIEVVDGQLRPGQPFAVLGDDLDPADEVTLELVADGEVHPLGITVTDGEGHFLVELMAPAGIADGDAYLQLTTRAGWAASLWVGVGDVAEAPAGAPVSPSVNPPPAWSDPSVIVLGVLVGGAALAVAHTVLSSRQRPRRA
jgi:hypothetical protein